MSQAAIIPLKPIPIKDRASVIFVYYGRIDVRDGAFVVINEVGGQ
jgi:CRISP-associated protein Cas1